MAKPPVNTDGDRCVGALAEARALARHMVNWQPGREAQGDYLVVEMNGIIGSLVSAPTNTFIHQFPDLVLMLQTGIALFEGQRQRPIRYQSPTSRTTLDAWLELFDSLAVQVVYAARFSDSDDYGQAEQHWNNWVSIIETMTR